MHNCKSTRKSLIDLVLDELQPTQKQQLLAELKNCPACSEEHSRLRSALRVSDQALQSALPSETFWPVYHERLTQRIENYSPHTAHLAPPSEVWSKLQKIVTASVRIPVPVAAALILMLSISTLFAMHSRRQLNAGSPPQATPPTANVEAKTVEVPVIQEKVVTRIVYVEKPRVRNAGSKLNRDTPLNRSSTMARLDGANGSATNSAAMSLVGFKPTEQVKIKVMKGSYRDEKRDEK